VSGSGSSWIRAYDFTASDGGWLDYISGGDTYATYSAGNGWGRSSIVSARGRLSIVSPIMSNTVTSVVTRYSIQSEVVAVGGNVSIRYGTQTTIDGSFVTVFSNGDTVTDYTSTGTYALSSQRLQLVHAKGTATNTPTWASNFYVASTTLQGTGTPPAGATTLSSAYGDAAYYNWQSGGTPLAYTSGVYGFMIDGATPTWNEVYNESHKYTTTVTGTGAPFVFSFTTLDTANTTPTFFVVRVCGDSAV